MIYPVSALIVVAQIGAGTLVASEVIRAGSPISMENTEVSPGSEDDGLHFIGMEASRTIYRGQDISETNTRAARLVRRNELVTVRFIRGPIMITMTGRALGEAGAGDSISVMNNQSRQIIQGTMQQEGWILAQ